MSTEQIADFDVRTVAVDGVHVVSVAGEVDIWTARGLAAALAEAGEPLLVDLTHVSFIDSSGLAALVGTRRSANGRDAHLAVVCSPDGAVGRLLHIGGIGKLFATYESPEDALEALSPPS